MKAPAPRCQSNTARIPTPPSTRTHAQIERLTNGTGSDFSQSAEPAWGPARWMVVETHGRTGGSSHMSYWGYDDQQPWNYQQPWNDDPQTPTVTYEPIKPAPASQPSSASAPTLGPILHAANSLADTASQRCTLAWEDAANEAMKIAQMANPGDAPPYAGTGNSNLTYASAEARLRVEQANQDAAEGTRKLAEKYNNGQPISEEEYDANIWQHHHAANIAENNYYASGGYKPQDIERGDGIRMIGEMRAGTAERTPHVREPENNESRAETARSHGRKPSKQPSKQPSGDGGSALDYGSSSKSARSRRDDGYGGKSRSTGRNR